MMQRNLNFQVGLLWSESLKQHWPVGSTVWINSSYISRKHSGSVGDSHHLKISKIARVQFCVVLYLV